MTTETEEYWEERRATEDASPYALPAMDYKAVTHHIVISSPVQCIIWATSEGAANQRAAQLAAMGYEVAVKSAFEKGEENQ